MQNRNKYFTNICITNEYLCSLTDPPEHIIRLYKAFLTKNGITNYTPSLELQMKLNNSLKQLTKCERRQQQRKRKHTCKQRKTTKQAKTVDFYS